MSQIPFIPIDTKQDIVYDHINQIWRGSGTLVAPFNMIEISNEQSVVNYLKPNQHLFISEDPMFDACYWMLWLTLDDDSKLVDKITNEIFSFYQSEDLTTGSVGYNFYFTKMRRPLKVQNILQPQNSERVLIYTYKSRQLRTGIIEMVYLTNKTNNRSIINGDDTDSSYYYTDTAIEGMLDGEFYG